MQTSNPDVSPLLDLETTNIIAVSNLVNSKVSIMKLMQELELLVLILTLEFMKPRRFNLNLLQTHSCTI